ncbi:molybdopterin molybdenumtransferase MoeA [Roseovarius sp. LXJ103]|uniref:molybdopterin-binding protein n=1 Tax=Roseovarius carneus TaxID=2853164 RepID=UPI000D60FE65|nr:gephyrin-like molybdotransferase Glp [Roseovarius carneus]MBZ8118533.1 molybdopterin molybdenumtransferase MoeA [Roseovarius carneus]PWE35774.1 molybdopterin molybdenumtransferase MoeA [Pelagicola sp. LXJ1103]
MSFDSVLIVDWSAANTRAPKRPSKDAIWLGLTTRGQTQEPIYCRSRIEAEAQIKSIITKEQAAGRRLLAGFDFPFGYPKGVARQITGSDDPFALWDWLAARITDDASGQNNRFDVAEQMNAAFPGPGPFWGKTHRDRWPGIPYRKEGITFDVAPEKRACDLKAQAASSCYQLCYSPTVGSQILMGLPMLSRLRKLPGVAVWPFEAHADAPTVLAEIWPGLIEPAVKTAPEEEIRDAAQVRLLSRALSRLSPEALGAMMHDLPDIAREEAWILGAGHGDMLSALAQDAPKPPPLRDDCFSLPAGVDWTPVDAALDALRAALRPVVSAETCALQDALGRVLAAPVIARRASPPSANSAVDGYGFAHASLPEGDPVLPLIEGRAAAGVPYAGRVPPGAAIRILTGAALPEGVDTVVLEEDVRAANGMLAFRAGIKPRANARRAGEDMSAGAEALPEGRILTPADLALAASVGVGRIEAYRRLRVAVVSTGDELCEAGEDAAHGQIYDANRPMLLALIAQMSLEPVDMGRIPDDRAALRKAMDSAAAQADVILTSGGASAGDEDHVSALLTEAGAMNEWRIALKPGRPLALGLWNGAPVFGLPGNPVAALVCTLIFARPALGLLAGAGWHRPQGFDLPAAFEKRKKPGRREYLRARIRDGRAEVFASEGSGRVSGLSWAEGLVELPDGAVHVQPGDPVRYIPYASFGF